MTCDQKKSSRNYTISQIAEQLDISPRTIRFYEEKGMIMPRRSSGNQRVYNSGDRARLRLILRGKRFGFSLEEIAKMIGMADNVPDEEEQIEKSLAYGEAKLKEIRERKQELELLEQDILATREKLIRRIAEIRNQTVRKQQEGKK
ncbi:MAG: MerR family transcriptional regulator [Desulfococcaceae bacterium]